MGCLTCKGFNQRFFSTAKFFQIKLWKLFDSGHIFSSFDICIAYIFVA